MENFNISKELEAFKIFKQSYTFEQKEIIEIDGILYSDSFPLCEEKDGKLISESETWINAGYNIKGPYSKVLSNLFPYTFSFRGKMLKSIEGFFQGIKFKDINMQNLVFEYSGINANSIKVASDHDWKQDGVLYFQGTPIKRNSKEYIDLIDELYISAIQNPLYRNVLKNCNKYILHSIGVLDKNETVFTRYEFEYQLNCLKDFLKATPNL